MSNSVSNPTLSPEIVQTLVKQYFAASRSDHKVENLVACFAEDGVSHEPAEAPALCGHTELRLFFQSMVNLFTTIGMTDEFISINGNAAAVKWHGHGFGKNGSEVTFEGIDVFQFNAEGKIQTLWGYWNPTAMLTALQSVDRQEVA